MKNKKLLANTFYLYVLTAVKMLFPLITLPYLTRVLTVESYGVVAYVKAYISYVQLLLDFGFLLSATKDIALQKENKNSVGHLTGNTIVEKILLAILAGIVTLAASNIIPLLKQNQPFVWLYFISCALTILIPDFLYRGIERMEYAAIPFACSKIAVIFLTFVLIKGDGDILLIPCLEIVGNLLAGCISLLFLKKLGIKIRIDGVKVWIRDIKESAIYFFSNFATTFFGALTILVVGIYMNKTDIAYWSICMQIVSAAKALYTPVANSLYPHMLVKKDLNLVRKIAVLFCFPLIIGVVAVLFFGEQIMTIIGGTEYYYAGYILKFLLPVLVVSFFSMLYGWPVLGAIGKVKETTLSTIIAAVIQIVGIGILLWINDLNLISLAFCCGISEIALLIIRLVIFNKNKSMFGNNEA